MKLEKERAEIVAKYDKVCSRGLAWLTYHPKLEGSNRWWSVARRGSSSQRWLISERRDLFSFISFLYLSEDSDWSFLRVHSRIGFWVHWVRFPTQTLLQVDLWLAPSHLLVATVAVRPCDSVSPADVGWPSVSVHFQRRGSVSQAASFTLTSVSCLLCGAWGTCDSSGSIAFTLRPWNSCQSFPPESVDELIHSDYGMCCEVEKTLV